MKNNLKKAKRLNRKKRVFLDYASITPVDSSVAKIVAKAEKFFWANPSSLHKEGVSANEQFQKAKMDIANILHCRSSEVFFTSGGTESLNIAIFGAVQSWQKEGKPHIITSSIEHPAVLEPIKKLVKNGKAEVSYLTPNDKGVISVESVNRELKENTILVAIQHANNEIGTIQPIQKIAKAIKIFKESRKKNPSSYDSHQIDYDSYPYFLVDASQSFLYELVSLERLQADMIVVDGIKIYGPRGTGVLVVKRGVQISPLSYGGGQEEGLRPGTQNVPGALGLAHAIKLGAFKREKESKRLLSIRDYAIYKILETFKSAVLNGGVENRLPNNVNMCFPGNDSEFLVIKLDLLGFSVSAASACHTLSLENSSYVIDSLGKKGCGSSSLRFTFGRDTKKSDIDMLVLALEDIIK